MSLIDALFGTGALGDSQQLNMTMADYQRQMVMNQMAQNAAQGNCVRSGQQAANTIAPGTVMGVGGMQNMFTTTNATAPIAPQRPSRKPEDIAMYTDEAQLNSEVFSTPIDTLANVWTTKYGDKWIELDAVADDPFFSLVYKRLYQRGLIETHYLTNRAQYVCRVPEH